MGSHDRLVREPGSRYIDFLIPGLLGMNLMGSAIWGMGFAIVDARRKKLMKRLDRHAHAAALLPALVPALAAGAAGDRSGRPCWVSAIWYSRCRCAGRWQAWRLLCLLGSLSFCALGLLIASRARTIEAASGLMNAGHDADVDRLRRILFGAAFPGRAAAGHQRAAADGG